MAKMKSQREQEGPNIEPTRGGCSPIRYQLALTAPPVAVVLLLLILGQQELARALRLITLDSPGTALLGDSLELACLYSLEGQQQQHAHPARESRPTANHVQGELSSGHSSGEPSSGGAAPHESLYAVKWYKDEMEFFRFLAHDLPRKMALPVPGIQVDVSTSGQPRVCGVNLIFKPATKQTGTMSNRPEALVNTPNRFQPPAP